MKGRISQSALGTRYGIGVSILAPVVNWAIATVATTMADVSKTKGIVMGERDGLKNRDEPRILLTIKWWKRGPPRSLVNNCVEF